jgi:hypothetical protein
MLSTYLLSAVFLAQASADKDPAKLGQKHGCTSDGRYWVHQDKGKKVYCFEGAGYGEDAAPPYVKSYFDESAGSAGSAAPKQTSLPDVPYSPTAAGAAAPAKPAASGGGGGGGSANPKTLFGGGGGGGGASAASADFRPGGSGGGKIKDALRDLARDPAPSANSVNATGKREPDPISPQVLNEIETGMDRATVLAKLGEPHGKILNTGDEGSLEIWTYLVRGNAYGSVRMENGKVIKVVRPR